MIDPNRGIDAMANSPWSRESTALDYLRSIKKTNGNQRIEQRDEGKRQIGTHFVNHSGNTT
jgi:hypothetical protein